MYDFLCTCVCALNVMYLCLVDFGIGLTQAVYNTTEQRGVVDVCANITSLPAGGSSVDAVVTIVTSDGTAIGKLFFFLSLTNRECHYALCVCVFNSLVKF